MIGGYGRGSSGGAPRGVRLSVRLVDAGARDEAELAVSSRALSLSLSRAFGLGPVAELVSDGEGAGGAVGTPLAAGGLTGATGVEGGVGMGGVLCHCVGATAGSGDTGNGKRGRENTTAPTSTMSATAETPP